MRASVAAYTLTESGSVPVTAVVMPAVPTTQAVITAPKDGQHFTTTPLVVTGSCGPGLSVRVFDNGALAGTTPCDTTGQFTLNITLQLGKNLLTSNNYDSFEQAGPVAPTITVYVDEPVAPQSLRDTQAPTAIVNGDTPQPLFQNTVFEPLGLVMGLGTFTTSAATNERIDTAGQGAFVVASVFIADTALFNSTMTNQGRRLLSKFGRRS